MDLNHRPSGYEPDELPGCSTPHQELSIFKWPRATAEKACADVPQGPPAAKSYRLNALWSGADRLRCRIWSAGVGARLDFGAALHHNQALLLVRHLDREAQLVGKIGPDDDQLAARLVRQLRRAAPIHHVGG